MQRRVMSLSVDSLRFERMKKLNVILVLVLLIIVISGTGIVSATEENGTLGTSAFNTTNYNLARTANDKNPVVWIQFKDLEKTGGLKSLTQWSNTVKLTFLLDGNNSESSTNPNATIGAQTGVVFRMGNGTYYSGSTIPKMPDGETIGWGSIGYQRIFDSQGNELDNAYVYVMVDSWNESVISKYPGERYVLLEYNRQSLFNVTITGGTNTAQPSGYGAFFGGSNAYGPYTQNKDAAAYAYFNATKPSGLGITGTIYKTNGPDGTIPYLSQAFVSDITHTTITSQQYLTTDPLTFNVPNAQIYIGILSSTGVWYNSSLLFSGQGVGNLTGTHNITFHVMTLQGTAIYNAKVYFVPDLQVGQRPIDVAQTGYTNASGMVTFYNQSASMAAYVGVTATGYKEHDETFTFTSDMIKEIRLSPPSLTVYVNVRDSSTTYYLTDFSFGIRNVSSGTWRNSTQESGYLFFDSTGANYEYPISINESISIEASKPGYQSAAKTFIVTHDTFEVTLLLRNLNNTAPSAGNGTLIVAVSDKKTGSMIPGASVSLEENGQTGITNAAGAITFRSITARTYTIGVIASGYQAAGDAATVADGDTVMKSIQLLPDGCAIAEDGRMTCNGQIVIPGVNVTATINQTANERAAGVVDVILDNAVSFFWLVVILLGAWFAKKIFFS